MIKYQNKEDVVMKIFVVTIVVILIFAPMIIFGVYRAKKNREILRILDEFTKLRNEEDMVLSEMNSLNVKKNEIDDFDSKMNKLEERLKEIKRREDELSKMVGEKNV